MTDPVRSPRKPSRRPEQALQRQIVAWLRAVLPPSSLVAHVPNGGARTPVEAAIMKGIGVVAGFPDLIVMVPGAQVIFLELKATRGRLSPHQAAIADQMSMLGFQHFVVTSIETCRAALRMAGIQTREEQL